MIWTLVLLMIIAVSVTTIALCLAFFDYTFDEYIASMFFLMSTLVFGVIFVLILDSNAYKLRAIQHYRNRIQAIELRIEKESDELKKEYLERVKKPQLQKCYDDWYNSLYNKEKNESLEESL